MSLDIYGLSFVHPDREVLFENISLSLGRGEKAALVGDNGVGKSTLLRVVAGQLVPAAGSVAAPAATYYVPQHFGQWDGVSIAGALGVAAKLDALGAIEGGDVAEAHYTVLADDWDIAARVERALSRWGLEGYDPARKLDTLSGGEKTKVFLAGIDIRRPELILMDEPTNHLDRATREVLYGLVADTGASVLVVSHDRTLLNLLDTTYELTPHGIDAYGGNYEFYKEQRDGRIRALADEVDQKRKELRKARAVAAAAQERKNRMDARGRSKMTKEGTPRIMLKTIMDGAQSSGKRLRDVHERKIAAITGELDEVCGLIPDQTGIKVRFGDSGLHRGKTLVAAEGLNFGYGERMLWPEYLDFHIESGDRVAISGRNGSGKTTLIRMILGELSPTAGRLRMADFSHLYVDQEYSLVDDRLTVVEHVSRHNPRRLPDHILRTELHRFRFPAGTWDKPCAALSGGEKMKLIFCSLVVADSEPDVFILDEPTNNLDISSLQVVTDSLKKYRGTLVVVSHDEYFLSEIGVTRRIEL